MFDDEFYWDAERVASHIKADRALREAAHVGKGMADGTVYVGLSPDTGKPMYTAPADAPGTYTFNQASKYAARSEEFGHTDWRVPTTDELNVLFNNRAAIGGFNETGVVPSGRYWSCWLYDRTVAMVQRFGDGVQSYGPGNDVSSLRCVRG